MTLHITMAMLAMAAAAAAQPALYEEDLTSSAPHRIAQWKQMKAFAESLPAKAMPTGATPAAMIGYPPPAIGKPTRERMEKVGEDEVAVYHRYWVEVAPGLETYGLYIVPKNAAKPAPLVIAQHGGAGYPEVATFRGGANYHDLVRGAVKEGYVVFAPLVVMHPRNEAKTTPIPTDVREQLDKAFREKGTTLLAVQIAKISRALDALLKRPEIDAKRVGMAGLSFGGYYTLRVSAFDKRIIAAVDSCSFKEGGLLKGEPDPVELVRMIVPRKLQIQAGTRDPLVSIDSIRAQVGKLGDLRGKVEVKEFDGVHEFNGAAAWEFLRHTLR